MTTDAHPADDRRRQGMRISLVEPARALHPTARSSLGTLSCRVEAARFSPHSTSQATANFILDDVVLDPETGLLFQHDRIVRSLCYPPRPDEEDAARRRAAEAQPFGEQIAFQGFNRYWRNHFHWLTQCVPAIAGYTTEQDWRDGVLLLPPVTANQMRALHLADSVPPKPVTIDPLRAIAFDRLVVSSLLSHQVAPSPFCRLVFEEMTGRAEPPDRSQAAGALYISRLDSDNRPMRNEPDLIEMMVSRGVDVVAANSLTIDETIAKFHAARLVVGAHGAGLGNIVFCRPGGTIYELHPAHSLLLSVTAGPNVLAQQHGLHYWADVHMSHGDFRRFGHRVPWTADLDLVRRRLDEIDRVHAPANEISR